MRWLSWWREEGGCDCSAHCSTSQPELLGDGVSSPSRAICFELPSFMLEEGRRKPKQAHPRSHLHLGSSLVQWLWAATCPFPFYSFFFQILLPCQALPVCLHAIVLSLFSFSQGRSLTAIPTSPEFIWEHEYAAWEALIQTESSCCVFIGLNSYHPYSCYLHTCLQTPEKYSYVYICFSKCTFVLQPLFKKKYIYI